MDKILVSLLLVIVALAALVSIETWFDLQRDDLINTSNNTITNVISNT